jgi:hypothetical protein
VARIRYDTIPSVSFGLLNQIELLFMLYPSVEEYLNWRFRTYLIHVLKRGSPCATSHGIPPLAAEHSHVVLNSEI